MCAKIHDNPSRYPDIALKITNVKLIVALEKKSDSQSLNSQ